MPLADVKDRIKSLVVKSINATGISSKYWGTPKSMMRTQQRVGQHGPAYGATFKELIPAQTVKQKPPLTIENRVHKIFRDEYEFEQWPAFVAKVPHGRVWGRYGTVITPDDVLLTDVSREFGAYGGLTGQAHSVNRQLTLHKCKKINGNVAVIACAGSNTYHHWQYDVMPRIHLLKLAGVLDAIDYFVVDCKHFSFQKQGLQTFGIAEDKIIHADHSWRFHVEADVLYVPSLPARLGTTSKWVVEFLRDTFLKEKKPNPLRLYISRKKAPSRKLLNESDVFAYLQTKGFVEFFAEDYSIRETASYFAAAEFVAGVHGAGFSNCAFLSEGAKVLDIVAPRHIDGNFWILSNYTGATFGYLFGKGERPPEDKDLIQSKVDEDIEVDLQELEAIFTLLEKQP